MKISKSVTSKVVEEDGGYRTVFTTGGFTVEKQIIVMTRVVPEKALLDVDTDTVSDIASALELFGPITSILHVDGHRIKTFERISEGTSYMVLEEVDEFDERDCLSDCRITKL